MKINVTQTILSYNNKPLLEMNEKDEKIEMTWRSIIFTALNSITRDEILTGEQKAKCYQITTKVYDSPEPDLTVEERAFIIERIEKVIVLPLIYGRAKEFFEDKEKKEDVKKQ